MSEVLEAALEVEIRRQERLAWLAENEEAISDYNETIAKYGLFSDGLRRF